MAYNNYGNYGYGAYPQYNANMGYQNFQQPIVQPQPVMPTQPQTNGIPFSEVFFGTLKEAEGHIVTPNKSVCFVNNSSGEIYVKSADSMGNQSFKTYKQVGTESPSLEPQAPTFNPNDYIKKTELNDLVAKPDLSNFAEKSDLKGLVRQETLESLFNDITKELNGIKKSIDIKKTLENGIKGV